MIKITRGSHIHVDKLRAYKIYINGIHRGDIRVGETKEFPVSDGFHTVQAKIDWCGSRELHVEVRDSAVALEVGSFTEFNKSSFAIISHLTYKRYEYLWLREDMPQWYEER